MAETTGISWCDATFNGFIGCTKVSPGCDSCYAEALAARYGWAKWGAGQPRYRTSAENWRKPLAWNRKAEQTGYRPRVFCASLADVFDNEVDPSWRDDLWELLRRTPNLRWMLLTKRIGNAAKMLPADWPFPHVGLMATIVNQEEFDRDYRKLVALPAVWHGISMEPLLGPIDILGAISHGGMQEQRGIRLPGSDQWRSGNNARRHDLEADQTQQTEIGRTSLGPISPSQDYDQSETHLCFVPSPSMATLQGTNSSRVNNQSPRRHKETQSPRQFGTGDLFGADPSFGLRTRDATLYAPKRRSESRGQTDSLTSRSNQIPPKRQQGETSGDCGGLWNPISRGIKNSSRRPLVSWIILGGESGPNRRPIEASWVLSLRDQCAEAGIAFHFKQWGGLHGKDGGCLVDGVEHKHFPAYLA